MKNVKVVIKGRDDKPHIREYAYAPQGKVAEIKEYPGFSGRPVSGETAGTQTPAGAGESTCITRTYSYDKLDRVTSMVYKKGSEVLESYAYKYDKNNQLMEKTEVTVTYEYDVNGNQVKESDSKSQVTTVNEYDAGNRLSKAVITVPEPEKFLQNCYRIN